MKAQLRGRSVQHTATVLHEGAFDVSYMHLQQWSAWLAFWIFEQPLRILPLLNETLMNEAEWHFGTQFIHIPSVNQSEKLTQNSWASLSMCMVLPQNVARFTTKSNGFACEMQFPQWSIWCGRWKRFEARVLHWMPIQGSLACWPPENTVPEFPKNHIARNPKQCWGWQNATFQRSDPYR